MSSQAPLLPALALTDNSTISLGDVLAKQLLTAQ